MFASAWQKIEYIYISVDYKITYLHFVLKWTKHRFVDVRYFKLFLFKKLHSHVSFFLERFYAQRLGFGT
jgi:hypothetical protein